MANLRIILPTDIDSATLSASPGLVATLPVENLQDATRGRVARSNAVVSGQHILGNFDSLKMISAFALVRHNLSAGATLTLKLYDGLNQGGNQTYDSGALTRGATILGWGEFDWGLYPWGGDSLSDWPVAYTDHYFTAALAQSFDLQIDDSTNADGYVQAARLFMGDYWSPASNFSFENAMQWIDPSTSERTDGGSLRSDAVDSFRGLEIPLDWLTPAERAEFVTIMGVVGKKKDVFVSCFPEDDDEERERDHAGAFKFTQDPKVIHNYVLNYKAGTLVLEEA